MKIFGRVILGVVVVVLIIITAAYVDGASFPVNHSTTVTDVVDSPPTKVFAIITNVNDGVSWRKAVKAVKVLPPDAGRDHWIEDLGHGQTMNFLATRTEPVNSAGTARRDVLLTDPGASYGGTWTYLLSPGDSPNQTKVSITETGFIQPPIYRFMMHHVMGMNANLNQYMMDLKAAAAKS